MENIYPFFIIFPLIADFFWDEAQIIRGNEGIVGLSAPPLKGAAVRGAVQMSVIAALGAVAVDEFEQLRTPVALVERRIVQEAEDGPLPRRLERGLQPQCLARKHLARVRAGGVLLIKPAARAAEGIVPVEEAVVEQNVNAFDAVRLEKFLHFRGGAPPVVMVSLQNDLAPGQRVDELKVRQRLLERNAPREVARKHRHVVRRQVRKGLTQALNVVRPLIAENIHRLAPAEREVQIADRVERHSRPLSCRSLKCILNVLDARRRFIVVDLRHVKAGAEVRIVPRHVKGRRGADTPLLGSGDKIARQTEAPVAAQLDLYKAENIAPPGDEVDLAEAAAELRGKDLIAVLAHEARRVYLAPKTGLFLFAEHITTPPAAF